MNKASGGDGIPVELFRILKDDAVKVLHSICQQIWKTQQWPHEWKGSVFILIPKKGNVKERSNYCTFALISHARLPCGSAGREYACNVGDLGSIPGLRGYPGEGKGYPLQLSGLENSMDYMYSPWGRKESDTTEQLSLSHTSKVTLKILHVRLQQYVNHELSDV